MPFSPVIFLVLLAIAAATLGMTWLLSLRWTRYRRLYQLKEWCSARRLRLVREKSKFPPLPPPLDRVDEPLRVRWMIRDDDNKPEDDRVTLVRAQTNTSTYNLLLLRRSGQVWPVTGLRPTVRSDTIVDQMKLFSYPSSMGVDRFTLMGEHPGFARKLNESAARGLLPPDIALVVGGDHLLLDFSDRPFDQLEFDRMLMLGRQIGQVVLGG
jgi:hypothetical protein